MTNYEKIKNMSVEEMASFLSEPDEVEELRAENERLREQLRQVKEILDGYVSD